MKVFTAVVVSTLTAASILIVAGCSPAVVGAPCTSDAFCPTGQTCVSGKCVIGDSPVVIPAGKEGDCGDLRDNDNDGLVDCLDPDCQGQVCRASRGPCDKPEVCDAKACQADGFMGGDIVCRGAAAECDVAERCSGTSTDCPADQQKCKPGETCGSNGMCMPGGMLDCVKNGCPAGQFCDTVMGSGCRPKLDDGLTCDSNTQCKSNVCTALYTDLDGDKFGEGNKPVTQRCGAMPVSGFAMQGGDCCDQDNKANPGQTAFYSTTDACDSFDYNCDGKEEPRDAQSTTCTDPSVCSTAADVCGAGEPGWPRPGMIPPCGEKEPYVERCLGAPTCNPADTKPQRCERVEVTRTQLCR